MELKECKSKEDLRNFFDNDELALGHTNYYHYTTLRNANNILENKQIWLCSLSKTANDNDERVRYEKLGNRIFSLCFSTGTSESLPLWYLYSGIEGNGVRIGINKKYFQQLVENPDVSLVEVDSNYEKFVDKPVFLKRNEYKVEYRDILYISPDSQKTGLYRIKHNVDTANDIDEETYKYLESKYSKFMKGLIWFYEKETRLQVEITNKDLIAKDKNYVVLLNLDKVLDNIYIRFAPEFGEISDDRLKEFEGIKKLSYSKLQKSAYAGQPKMELKRKACKDCPKNKA